MATQIRAKFRCQSVTTSEHWDKARKIIQSVRLLPVTGVEGEDLVFGKASPAGSLELTIDNPPAAAEFYPGRTFYVDFTPADA